MPKNKQSTSPTRRHRPFYEHPLFKVALGIFILIAATLAILHFAQPSTPQPTTPTTTSSAQSFSTASSSGAASQSANDDTTVADTAATSSSSVNPDGKTPTHYDGEDPNGDASLTGFFSAARFSGDKLILRVTIDQYLPGGTCSLTISDGTHSLAKSAALTPVAATSSCEGFDVPASELSDFSRPLYLTINLTSGDKTGTIEGKID